MAWGLLLGGRQYGAVDYACALTVTAGCALFVLTGSIAAPHLAAAALDGSTSSGGGAGSGDGGTSSLLVYGLALLGAFLLFDGLTSTAQDKLFAQHEMHSINQLLWVSAWSAGIRCAPLPCRPASTALLLEGGAAAAASGVACCGLEQPSACLPACAHAARCPCLPRSLALLMAGGQLTPALAFVGRHPSALAYILALSAVSTAVQVRARASTAGACAGCRRAAASTRRAVASLAYSPQPMCPLLPLPSSLCSSSFSTPSSSTARCTLR